jgi:putative tryptophan/tyrosine transport system substrate-binding protein
MRRREFIAGLGSAVAWPEVVRAQQAALPIIGFLSSESPDLWQRRLGAFRQGLSEGGYVEGRDVTFEYRLAENRLERLPALAAELVQRRVSMIVALPTPAGRPPKPRPIRSRSFLSWALTRSNQALLQALRVPAGTLPVSRM